MAKIIKIDIDDNITNSRWLMFTRWPKSLKTPKDVLRFWGVLGFTKGEQKAVLKHFLTLPFAESMPSNLKKEIKKLLEDNNAN